MLRRALILVPLLSLAFGADVSGTWQLTVQTSQGSGNPTMELKQDGEKLTGTFHSQVFGDAKLAGTVKGSAIEFGFKGEAGGATLDITYKGTIEGPTSMKGTASYSGVDESASWTATKK